MIYHWIVGYVMKGGRQEQSKQTLILKDTLREMLKFVYFW